MGKAVWKAAGFVLVINLAFVYVGYTITSVSGRRGGMEAALMEVSPEAGEKIFWGRGKCSTCHSIGGKGSAIRCPNQGVLLPKFPVPLWERAATRVDGKTAAEYVVESVYNPSAYVVEGYRDGLMPHVKNPPISLTDDEILSVLVYLVSTSNEDGEVGAETLSALVRAQQPYKTGQIQVKETVAKLQLPEGDPEFGRDVFEEMKCYTCHKIEGEKFPTRKEDEGGVGPDLTGIGGVQPQIYLFESVINPNAVIVQGEGFVGDDELSRMPEYHDTLNLRDLVDLVTFLSSLGAEQGEPGESEDQ